jgi:hypothetical protein
VDFEQAIGDVDAEIGVDADQVRVERRVVQLRQRQTIGDYGLTKLLVAINDDMRGVEQPRFRQLGDRASSIIRGEHSIAE